MLEAKNPLTTYGDLLVYKASLELASPLDVLCPVTPMTYTKALQDKNGACRWLELWRSLMNEAATHPWELREWDVTLAVEHPVRVRAESMVEHGYYDDNWVFHEPFDPAVMRCRDGVFDGLWQFHEYPTSRIVHLHELPGLKACDNHDLVEADRILASSRPVWGKYGTSSSSSVASAGDTMEGDVDAPILDNNFDFDVMWL